MTDQIPQIYATMAAHIRGVWLLIITFFDGLWHLAEEGHVARRASLVAAWVLTMQTYYWCFDVVMESGYDPIAMGAAFAILTPVSGLMGMVIKFYNEGRKQSSE